MDINERIEKAAAVISRSCNDAVFDDIEQHPERAELHRYACQLYRSMAKASIRAAFPELFADPPEAWIAPWEPTRAMEDAADSIDGAYEAMFGDAHYRVMRDAHVHATS